MEVTFNFFKEEGSLKKKKKEPQLWWAATYMLAGLGTERLHKMQSLF